MRHHTMVSALVLLNGDTVYHVQLTSEAVSAPVLLTGDTVYHVQLTGEAVSAIS